MALSEADLAAARDTQVWAMTDEATIDDFTPTNDGRGATVDGWTTRAGTPFPARVAPPTGRTAQIVAERYGAEATHIATLPAGTVVGLRAHVVVGAATYEVIGSLSGGSWETATRLVTKAVG